VRKAVIGALLIGLLFGPATCLTGLAVLLNPAAKTSCLPGAGLSVGAIPHSLSVTTIDGDTFTLNHRQLKHAATIITVGDRTNGVGRDGVVIALMAALTESTLEMLSNTSAYPESANHPHDGDGGDHDSLGLFQMRPSTGWGTVADLMDPYYQARAFYGGPTGPNQGSPRGLLDIPGWQEMDKGAAAQAVEVSAYPDRYARFEPVAEKIIEALTGGRGGGDDVGTPVPETSSVVFPLPAGVGVKTSGFGIRVHPFTGETKLHTGVDYSAPTGTPIFAAADGRVYFAGTSAGYGHIILIDHTVNGQRVSSGYAHMLGERIYVRAGDPVTAGQHIADIGTSGYTTGPHLHFEIRPGGGWSAPVDPEPWLASHGGATLRRATTTASGCAA
jgi:murein DD-endopeptidase MepM/ murein hydrolase activator NlpD